MSPDYGSLLASGRILRICVMGRRHVFLLLKVCLGTRLSMNDFGFCAFLFAGKFV